ncbi:MAG: hypothetical protein K6B15_03745 [Parasporobacterium sp.]|nr:hypothetical protein [Parasporobacterium sp.]
MKEIVDLILESMVKKDALSLPMADRYRATENGIPAAIRHMTCWKSISKINYITHLIEDEKRKQAVLVANVQEGEIESLLAFRVKAQNELIEELEIYTIRSRAEAGFWFWPEEMKNMPKGWSSPITEENKASREELERLAKDIFEPKTSKHYLGSEDNFGMEAGSVVREHIDYISAMAVDGAPAANFANVPESGRIAMPMLEMFPVRPEDLNARVLVVDESQGTIAVIGKVDGFVSPYIVSNETSTCFVPKEMIEMHRRTLTEERMKGQKLLEEMPATAVTLQIVRFHSGKIQGTDQIIVLGPCGSHIVWTEN